MAYHLNDNVYTKSFTPREHQVELLDAACERNIIVCLCNSSGKSFLASKVINDIANKSITEGARVTLYVSDSPSVISKKAACIRRLTDFAVGEYTNATMYSKMEEWKDSLKSQQVLVMLSSIAVMLLKQGILLMSQINLIILHGCHCILRKDPVPMKELMKFYFKSSKRPHVLGLISSLFSSGIEPARLEAEIKKLEENLDCDVESASNVVSVLRYGTKPHEVVLECALHEPTSIDKLIEKEIEDAILFLKDHRYDPNEIYEGFSEELEDIPDPRTEPEEIFKELLDVLHNLGPWSADKAAFVLLLQIEKLKVTTPYERHFLLLCMTSSVLVKIRAIFDDFFKDYCEKDRLYKFSSPKIVRLIEVLKKFQPEKVESDLEDFSEEDEELEEDGEGEREEAPNQKEKNETGCVPPKSCKVSAEENSEPTSDSRCQCESIYKYLLARLESNMIDDFYAINETKNYVSRANSFNNFSNNETENKAVKCNCKQTDCPHKSGHNESKSTNNKSVISNENLDSESVSKNRDIAKKNLNNLLQKKNGVVLLTDEVSRKEDYRVDKKSSASKNINLNSSENYLQSHEYLYLPKYKVDRYARYDRFQGMNQVKGFERGDFIFRQIKNYSDLDPQLLCGLIFVEQKFTAKVLFHVFNDLKQIDEDFSFLSVHFTVGKMVDSSKDPKGAENEHRKQELVLKRFRMRECNLLISTSFLEEGIDLPKCNLVVRFDVPRDYRSYVNTKERARAVDSLHCLMITSIEREDFIEELAKYYEIEQLLLRQCKNIEPLEEEELEADQYLGLIQPFCPLLKQDCPYVDLSTAIALVNRYCAKLPSDTFTRLTPLWSVKTVQLHNDTMYTCSIRLPINSPVKQEITGLPMPTKVLARRFAAFQCCQQLHLARELDDTLQPISKESFWMREEEQLTTTPEELEEMIPKDSLEPRPGTTKRRQYYYKRIADSLTDCRPVAEQESFLYDISMALTCPLPEEQNTRGRKIHAPEDSLQGFGILTLKNIPKIGAFPIFTRSGEVQVKLQLAPSTVVLSESQIDKIVAFIHYTFTSVLRLQKYLMMFDPDSSENSYFVVPTKKDINSSHVEVDWEFLDLIFEKRNQVPVFIPEEERKNFIFDPEQFEDAVVSPWYRNQDQPQYFYVAEICNHLSPKSAFPGVEYETFEEYYLKKYDIQIQNGAQALLDVDHTSARLNFLTPRYVNRKGVALPTTSEEKKKAKRENLEQKQILVPELCNIHPFPATLWRKAVCLPCILHRINALLLADQVRRIVATDIGIGCTDLSVDFHWKPLDFGWSLIDVFSQSKANQKLEEKKEDDGEGDDRRNEQSSKEASKEERNAHCTQQKLSELTENGEHIEEIKCSPWVEIGTWSNEMADIKGKTMSFDDSDELDSDITLPGNVTMIDQENLNDTNGWNSSVLSFGNRENIRYGSPTSWMGPSRALDDDFSDLMSDNSFSDDYYDEDSSSSVSDTENGGLRIEFTGENVAEAIEDNKIVSSSLKDFNENEEDEPWLLENGDIEPKFVEYVDRFQKTIKKHQEVIRSSGILFGKNERFDYTRSHREPNSKCNSFNTKNDQESVERASFGNCDNKFPQLSLETADKLKRLKYTSLIVEVLEKHKQEIHCKSTEKSEVCEADSKNLVPKKLGDDEKNSCREFSFDEQPDLSGHPGPSPSLILQALTMSNANDGINLERLETIGDSFLKYAITTYLYCTYENIHEGKLSHLRSKQVSNFNLYRLGRRKVLGESMIATKFEPHDNWLPPCYYVPRELERALIEAGVPASHWNRADLPSLRNLSKEEICQLVRERGEKLGIVSAETGLPTSNIPSLNLENMPCFIPYNLMTQHSIPDKSIADCVEALIGAYLVACGPRGALLFMSWLGIKVLPRKEKSSSYKDALEAERTVGCTAPFKVSSGNGEIWNQVCFGDLKSPKPPLLRHIPDPEGELNRLLRGFDVFEDSIQYHFRDRSYLLQALTHASYYPNRLTDCYQRLEFLGDAVLDYLITRHLYEDSRHHSPGALTDLRSALVNNTIFASLAVRHSFHKYFRHLCPGLDEVLDRFVRIQQENGHSISEECYLMGEDECEEAEDVEVPKALGDVFESVAGAIFLDSGMSLDAVWRVYYRIMKNEIELFSTNVPKSPIRELFELEPETAQFGKPEKLADGRRVRVTVEVFGKGLFSGIGRNYRIAKCTAAKCALKQLKRKGLLERRK